MDVNPLRGEVWLVDLGSNGGKRPAIVVNVDLSINRPTRLVVPLRKNVTKSSAAVWQVLIEPSEENGMLSTSLTDL